MSDIRTAKSSQPSLVGRSASSLKPSWDDPVKTLVLTGDDVEQLTASDWDMVLSEYMEIVFARTTPEQKLRIVEETKKRGDNTVAVVRISFLRIFLYRYQGLDWRWSK